jgi:mannitol-1-/sugar-/sorbitol-6-/2-deoxyglucose-6-phosphatase
MLRAAIFDLDGLLIDSEPWWRKAEVELFAEVGIHLREEQCIETTGLRIDEVVQYRRSQKPWEGPPTTQELADRIVERVIALVREHAEPKAGREHAIDVCSTAKLRLAVASSSPLRLIEASLDRLQLRSRFELIVSAERERYGKPHPAVFITTADRLGVDPSECIVFEDSMRGVIAAKAAGMRCIAVPEHDDPRFVIADRVLPSLEAFDGSMI